jgi:hypothetical protein
MTNEYVKSEDFVIVSKIVRLNHSELQGSCDLDLATSKSFGSSTSYDQSVLEILRLFDTFQILRGNHSDIYFRPL